MSPTEKNPFSVAAVCWGESHPPMRWMDRLRLGKLEACRNMTPDEEAKCRKAFREMMWRYKSWESLIADEWEVTRDMKWMEELYAASRLTGSLAEIVDAREAVIKKDQEKEAITDRQAVTAHQLPAPKATVDKGGQFSLF